jgi:hypothetical protein
MSKAPGEVDDAQFVGEKLAEPFEITWRECPGNPGYRVSNDGRVETDLVIGGRPQPRRSGNWRQKKQMTHRSGHKYVCLRGGSSRFVHTLVLEAFVGPCPDGMECLHGDDNPANNRMDNLRWGTRRENIADAMKRNRTPSGERHWNCSISQSTLSEIFAKKRDGLRVFEIARELGLKPQTVSKIINGKRRKREANVDAA